MTDTLTLAHLSDVHLSPVRGVALRQLNVKRGLGYLNWQRKRKYVHRAASLDLVVQDLKAQRPDHIAVTGDLINLGLPGEYEAARAWLDDVGPPQVVTVVPGNHDIYTNLRNHPGVELWSEYMQPDAWGAKLLSGCVAPPTAEGFPFVRRIGRIALIGLNSAVKTPPFVASGRLGEAQMAVLPGLLERTHREGLVRVVLIHHPPLPGLAPGRRALRDAAELERVLAVHGAELVLHGHNHRDNHVDLAWAKGRIPVIGVASGSGARAHKDEPLGRYNLLHITPTESGAQIECITRGLDASGSRVEQVDRKRLDASTPAP
jgi:3',5'-cyclic AMP phosphodiesterase CpdA